MKAVFIVSSVVFLSSVFTFLSANKREQMVASFAVAFITLGVTIAAVVLDREFRKP